MLIGSYPRAPQTTYLNLYTSNDGLSWRYRGHLLKSGYAIANGDIVSIWGNTYLFKNNDGKYYLYYEIGANGGGTWETCLATCTDLFYENEDGTMGNWSHSSINPILPAGTYDISPELISRVRPGNVEIAKGEDNQPLKCDGKYYMYFHNVYTQGPQTTVPVTSSLMNIERAYSYDLEHWINEGIIYDNRNLPTVANGHNADHAICQFKGRTYLFYSTNVNADTQNEKIHYIIDDRPLHELLKLKG